MKIIKSLFWTMMASVAGIALVVIAGLTNIDVVRLNLKLLEGIGSHEIDDLLAGFALILAGLALDRAAAERRRLQQANTEAEKLHVLHATMRTVQDIVNNSLNQMQFFRMEAEGLVSAQTLRALDESIEETTVRLEALGNLESVHETPMATGDGIEYTVPQPTADGGIYQAQGFSLAVVQRS